MVPAGRDHSETSQPARDPMVYAERRANQSGHAGGDIRQHVSALLQR